MKVSTRKELPRFKQCLKSCSLLALTLMLLLLLGVAAGGITVKRSPEPSALYWPVEEASTYTFGPPSFLLHDTTGSHQHAKEEWSFRKSRQFRPRVQKRRQQIYTESAEAVNYDGDFGAKIATRRIIDLGSPDQIIPPSRRMIDPGRPVALDRLAQPSSAIRQTEPDQEASPSENVRVVRQPRPIASEIEPKIGRDDANITVISGGWLPISESPQDVVKSSSISPQVNQSHPFRHAQLLQRRKWLAANTTLNGTDVLKKKEEYLVSKVQNAEIFKDATTRRDSTNRLLNRLRLQTTSTPQTLEVESVSVQPIPIQTSSSIVIRAGNRTRLRVNRRPALSFTVQNPFSIAVLQVNITPPEPTTMVPNFDVEPSVKIDTTLELQSVEFKKNDESEVSEVAERPIILDEARYPPVTSTPKEALNETVAEDEDVVSRRLEFVAPSQAFDNVKSSTEAGSLENSQAFDKTVDTEPSQAIDKLSSSTETVQSTRQVDEVIAKVQVVSSDVEKVKNETDSNEKLAESRDLVVKEKPLEIIKGVDAMDFIKSIVDVTTITKNESKSIGTLESKSIATSVIKESEKRKDSVNGTLVDSLKNNSANQQLRGNVNNKVDHANSSVTRNLEQVTRSASEFLFELPKSEVEPSKTQRPNRTSYFDDVSRFNEEQRQISRSYGGEESTDGAEKVAPTGTSVYFIGIIGIIPIAGGALYLAKIFNRKRLERLHDSDTASVTGFRKGNALLQPLHLGTKKSNKPSGRYEGAEIIAQVRVSPWEFPRSKLRLLSVIGEGNFGQVWKAEAEDICGFDGRLIVAVKTVKEGAAWREKEELLREIKLMQQLGPHQNVVSILGCCTDHEPYYLIMEYVMSGRLLTYLRNHRLKKSYYNFSRDPENLTSRDLTSICYNVAKGMEFIASKGIIHRDLAARNVLIDHNKVAKVADFGLSRSVKDTGSEIYEQRSKGALPIRWMAPESLGQSVFTKKSDVWSFGVFAWEVITLGSTPYPGLSAREVMRRVRENLRLERPPHCKPELYKVMTRCWASDPARRPDFSELKQEFSKMLDCSNEYVDLDKFHESPYYHTLQHKDEEKV